MTLNITETDNAMEVDLAMSAAKYFKLTPGRANSIRQEIVEVVSQWCKVAKTMGIPASETERMKRAFRVD